MYLLDSVLHDMLNNIKIAYKFLESTSQYTNHSKAMKQFFGVVTIWGPIVMLSRCC